MHDIYSTRWWMLAPHHPDDLAESDGLSRVGEQQTQDQALLPGAEIQLDALPPDLHRPQHTESQRFFVVTDRHEPSLLYAL
ncbi:hypothetical protein [Actinoplanes solisilvae]|uniref:hypothetical protein n=1 Tax=Actinoplanes solisilvae TaxID=2486853 RepID=UPI001F0BA184|nr:hypothetical protein [Actinoplanes solisilvae]